MYKDEELRRQSTGKSYIPKRKSDHKTFKRGVEKVIQLMEINNIYFPSEYHF